MSDRDQSSQSSQSPTSEGLVEILVRLRTRVDRHFDDALARTPEGFACKPGCWECCRPRFSVFEVEAAPIRQALADMAVHDPETRERVRQQGHDAELGHCALLIDGRCSVYEQRPMICRSHGLPVGFQDPDDAQGVFVDHCPLNFVDAEVPVESVLMLDAVNRPLAVLAELWNRGAPRVALADLATEGDQ